MLTEIFVKDAANVVLLLDLLGEQDFYVRFNGVQMLAALLAGARERLQVCILTAPHGLSRLIDLLDDRREIIRNGMRLVLLVFSYHFGTGIQPQTS